MSNPITAYLRSVGRFYRDAFTPAPPPDDMPAEIYASTLNGQMNAMKTTIRDLVIEAMGEVCHRRDGH